MTATDTTTPFDWYRRTVESLRISGRSASTARLYAREVRLMGEWLDKPLLEADEEDIRRYYLHRVVDRGLSASSVRILICGLMFLALGTSYLCSRARCRRSLCHHGIASLSTTPTRMNSPTPMTERMAMAAKTRSVRN